MRRSSNHSHEDDLKTDVARCSVVEYVKKLAVACRVPLRVGEGPVADVPALEFDCRARHANSGCSASTIIPNSAHSMADEEQLREFSDGGKLKCIVVMQDVPNQCTRDVSLTLASQVEFANSFDCQSLSQGLNLVVTEKTTPPRTVSCP